MKKWIKAFTKPQERQARNSNISSYTLNLNSTIKSFRNPVKVFQETKRHIKRFYMFITANNKGKLFISCLLFIVTCVNVDSTRDWPIYL
jgi:hypothetical protein